MRPKPELGPAHRDRAEADPGQVADGVHRDLRVVGAGLDAQVAVGAVDVDVVAREVRELLERLRAPVGQAEPVVAVLVDEQGRPEPEGQGEPRRGQADRLAGVVGRQVVGALDRPDRAGVPALRHPLGGQRPRLQQLDEVLPGGGGDVERREVEPVLGLRGDAGLVLPAEGVGALAAGRRPRALAIVGEGDRARTERADSDGGGSTAADETPPGDRTSGHRQPSTTAVSRDSGSDSALTASASCLISSWVRSS